MSRYELRKLLMALPPNQAAYAAGFLAQLHGVTNLVNNDWTDGAHDARMELLKLRDVEEDDGG